MNTFLKITRYPYEEPYHLNLTIEISNGRQRGQIEFYTCAETLKEWGTALAEFPKHKDSVYLWECGSESREDRCAYYLRFRAFTTNALGHPALHVRFNNNAELPEREITEFCIAVEPARLNRLGTLFLNFAKLEHEVLLWTTTEAKLFETKEAAEELFKGHNHAPHVA